VDERPAFLARACWSRRVATGALCKAEATGANGSLCAGAEVRKIALRELR